MQLPIDASKRPYRAKYLEETRLLTSWFVFGTSADGTLVDINDGDGDVFTSVPADMAERILKARDAFVAAIEAELAL